MANSFCKGLIVAFGWSQREKNGELTTAIGRGDLAAMEKALKRGADANASNYDYISPLFQLVTRDNPTFTAQAAKLLLQYKADARVIDNKKKKNTLLHTIASYYYDNSACIPALVEAGADVLARNHYGQTPLQTALLHGKIEAAQQLLSLGGAREATADNDGRTILMSAAEKGVPDTLFADILKTGVDVNASPEGLVPALHLVVQRKAGAQIDMLLNMPGIYIDIRDPTGRTPLNTAVQGGSNAIVRRLIDAHATLDLAGDDHMTPLAHAVQAGSQDITETLIKAGAALDLPDGGGRTPLSIAAAAGNIRLVVTLLEAAKEKGQKLALDRALADSAERGHGRVVELLISAGADVNAPDKNGRTPLMRAVASDQPETLGILINAGAKPEMVDDHKLDAYDHAVSMNKNLAKSFLGRYRMNAAASAPTAPGHAPQTAAADAYRYTRLSDYSLEVREGDGLASIFNFSTQQLILRDMERPAPPVVQNFADIQRQDAVLEAYEKLKEMGGNPPDPRVASAQKKHFGLGAKPQ